MDSNYHDTYLLCKDVPVYNLLVNPGIDSLIYNELQDGVTGYNPEKLARLICSISHLIKHLQ